MKNLTILSVLTLLIFAVATNAWGQNDSVSSKPNIVLILVDDSGLMDFGIYGGEARTPNIDRLAQGGFMFTNMHASPVCAPSRAMLLTGTDSHLAGVANLPEMLPEEYQSKPGYGGELNERVQTIATRLKEVNYNTYAAGKWHLGHNEKTLPTKRGFDRSYILGGSGASNYDSRGYLPQKPHAHWYADGEEVELPEDFYSSETYIDKAISFHEEEQNKDNPFFSYIAFQAIHTPVQAPKEFVEHYLEIYAKGWDEMRQNRFEKAKLLGLIPESAPLNGNIPISEKWDDLSKKEQKKYATSMAVTAGMIEAMDYHIGRYVTYLSENGLLENTVFFVTSDNGPDGGDYTIGIPWAIKNGYHRDFEEKGGKGYFGFMGTGFANAVSSPFSYFKYYTGEGGLRVPLIVSGKNIPKNTSNTFTFFTDIAPTIYDIAGISTSANAGFAPVTGKSLFPHMNDLSQPVYKENEGVGIEAASSSAYFMNGYKIVKNNIPDGDNVWHLHHIESDPGEVVDLAAQKPELFKKMLMAYSEYEKEVGVLQMPEGYSAQGFVANKATASMVVEFLPIVLFIIAVVAFIGFFIWKRRQNLKKNGVEAL
jgi:arylsulfatase/uncharacterized sulfatase